MKTLGFARANNASASRRRGDAEYIVLLNDDTVVTPGWLGRLIGHLQDETIGLAGPVSNWTGNEARIDAPYADDLDGLDEFAAERAKQHPGDVFDIPVLAMYCVAVRKSLIDGLGRLTTSASRWACSRTTTSRCASGRPASGSCASKACSSITGVGVVPAHEPGRVRRPVRSQ